MDDTQPSNFDLTAVSLIPTDELVNELLNRFPACVVAYETGDETSSFLWDGGINTVLGLIERFRDLVRDDVEIV